MANYASLYVHLVWSTDRRRALVTPGIESEVYAIIGAKCRALRCVAIAVGGMPDHVHLLAEIHPTVAVAVLAKEVKGASSHAAVHAVGGGARFRWQTGYGAFTVGERDVPKVKDYVRRQKLHHAARTLSTRLEWIPPPRP